MGEPPALNGKHILLLEDDADARDSMAMLLELAGAHVVSTPTAEDALAALHQEEFDAGVTDVAMPGLRAGFDDQMLKPVAPTALYDVLTNLMRRS
jgi:DNA-binding response OmpR family regulator